MAVLEPGSLPGMEVKWKRRARASMGAFSGRMWATMEWIFSARAIWMRRETSSRPRPAP